MINESISPVEIFSVDLQALTEIQVGFINLDNEFIYFRKGEAENNIEIVLHWAPIIAAALGWGAYQLVTKYKVIKENVKEIIEDIKKYSKPIAQELAAEPPRHPVPVFREIACPDELEITVTLEVLKAIGGDVRYLPEEQRGKFRYFVNDKQYCLFIRRDDGTFNGFLGNDPNIIISLKESFESEWDELSKIQESLLPNVKGIDEASKWDQTV